jgi:predicted PhzF superfamily epimerase YddE/YHI9
VVCVVPAFPATALMQQVAAEFGLVTAFLAIASDAPALRWFTPVVEEAMCGHATLAAAWVMLHRLRPGTDEVAFSTPAGILTVRRAGEHYESDLPAKPAQSCAEPAGLAVALGVVPVAVLRAASYIAVLESAAAVAGLAPDIAGLGCLDLPGVVATATGEGYGCDIVSRYFAPTKGLPEDPATGAAHAQMVPYWAARLGRERLQARQLSVWGAVMACELHGDRVALRTGVTPFMEGISRWTWGATESATRRGGSGRHEMPCDPHCRSRRRPVPPPSGPSWPPSSDPCARGQRRRSRSPPRARGR